MAAHDGVADLALILPLIASGHSSGNMDSQRKEKTP